MKENYAPVIHMEVFDVDDALYKYYNVDKEKLLAEYTAVQEST